MMDRDSALNKSSLCFFQNFVPSYHTHHTKKWGRYQYMITNLPFLIYRHDMIGHYTLFLSPKPSDHPFSLVPKTPTRSTHIPKPNLLTNLISKKTTPQNPPSQKPQPSDHSRPSYPIPSPKPSNPEPSPPPPQNLISPQRLSPQLANRKSLPSDEIQPRRPFFFSIPWLAGALRFLGGGPRFASLCRPRDPVAALGGRDGCSIWEFASRGTREGVSGGEGQEGGLGSRGNKDGGLGIGGVVTF
ncbi:hypothetical protein BS50DRAFT_413158 [Corynespora cassiicola Philippines]|uniref:Uncharacterized protein n=1 Tax=Corynespora cassiicola Philippines TaxID=1448308 RepID=A0A2T2NLN9_CORCC|nr:hypothetical protein BS50DRAFT_413158 [Corynespora cassiicola Philippines]